MDAGKLKDRITIQTRDSLGVWTDLCRVWAQIRPLSAKEVIDRGDIPQNATHQITIRVRNDVKSTARVVFKGRIYDIISILPHYQTRDRLELTCEELHEMPDIITVMRMTRIIGDLNIVKSEQLPDRDVSCCIVDIQHSHNQVGTDPVTWNKKVQIDCYLEEDLKQGDQIRLTGQGEFFVTETRQTKHFLSVTATQAKRGAE